MVYIEWNDATTINAITIDDAELTPEDYFVDADMLTITQQAVEAKDPAKDGILEVTVIFDEGHDNLDINVIDTFAASEVVSISVLTQPLLKYSEGMALDLSSLVVALIWSDGTVKQVEYTDFADNDLTTDLDDGTMLTVDDKHGQTVNIVHIPSGEIAITDQLIVVIPTEPTIKEVIFNNLGEKASAEGVAATSVDYVIGSTLVTLNWNNFGKIKTGTKLYVAQGAVNNYLEAENPEETLECRFVNVSKGKFGVRASAMIGKGSTGKIAITANNIGESWHDWRISVYRQSWTIGGKRLSVVVDHAKKNINITLARDGFGGGLTILLVTMLKK